MTSQSRQLTDGEKALLTELFTHPGLGLLRDIYKGNHEKAVMEGAKARVQELAGGKAYTANPSDKDFREAILWSDVLKTLDDSAKTITTTQMFSVQ